MASHPAAHPVRGVTDTLARDRAARIAELRYRLSFALPRDVREPVSGRAVIRFSLAEQGRVVLDFDAPPRAVHHVEAGGRPLTLSPVEGHLVVPPEYTRAGENELVVEFTAGDAPLNRRAGLLYTLFVPARAHLAFPCFDQPDLKARFALTLDLPAGWHAAANAPEVARTPLADGVRVAFAETLPLPTYLFAFAAGDLHVETRASRGREVRVFHDGCRGEALERNLDAVVDLHAAALEWLERYTGIPCPFLPFGLVLVPSFQFRGMEHPGAVLYDAARLLLPSPATETQQVERASLIAHETAHMWFGNLVTMPWFSDVWLKEVFANLLASKMVEEIFPHLDHDVRFLLAHQPEAYAIDRTAGANPVRQPLTNLLDAGQLYGPIVYQKSVVVMRQLEETIGPHVFRQAVREYLRRHAWGTAAWPDLLEAFRGAAGSAVPERWRVWIEERGRPAVRTTVRHGRAGGTSLRLDVQDPLGRGVTWPQTVRIAAGHGGDVRVLTVALTGRSVRVRDAASPSAPDWLLPGGASAYGLFVLDGTTRAYLLEQIGSLTDPGIRADAWLSLWENAAAGHLAPAAFVRAAVRALPAEANEQIRERVLGWTARAFWRLLAGDERQTMGPALEALLRDEIERASSATWRAACFNAYRDLACSREAVGWLVRVLERQEHVPGLRLDEGGELAVAMEVAVRGWPGAGDLLRTRAARLTRPDLRAECAFVAPALDAEAAVREAAFERLQRPEHRRPEPWALQSLRYLNHPLREAHARRFVRPALALLPELQRTGDIFFPARWAEAALWGHQSPPAAASVRRLLRGANGWSERLRWIVLAAADDLFRTARRTRPRTEGDG